MPATSNRKHAASAYQKVKARAKARSAAVTLAGQDIDERNQGRSPIVEASFFHKKQRPGVGVCHRCSGAALAARVFGVRGR